jgi:selenocysteine-specific elongation factor
LTKGLVTALAKLGFHDPPIVPVSATVELEGYLPANIGTSIAALLASNSVWRHELVHRTGQHAPFVFAIDHCFSIKGSGTILTGTVLQGSAGVGDARRLLVD